MSTLSTEAQEEKLRHEKARKFLLWIGIGSMVMAFAGLTSAYMVRRGAGNWLQFELPTMFYFSTAIILLSSVTMNWALSSVKEGKTKNSRIALLSTLALGICFVFTQFSAWSSLVDQNIFFTGSSSNASGSFLYILSGLHLAHLAAGLMALVVVNVKNINNKYNPSDYLGVKLCALFWHFLDGLWVYLFLFLYFIR
jgi:cytochrome c oxidase subunit 3